MYVRKWQFFAFVIGQGKTEEVDNTNRERKTEVETTNSETDN